jgi:hypothetical protein
MGTERDDFDWIHMAQDRVPERALVDMAMNFRAPIEGGKVLDCQTDYQLLKNDSAP